MDSGACPHSAPQPMYVGEMRRAVLACMLLAFAPRACPQSNTEDSPQRLVTLNVVATNARGEPVTDLRAADVQLREDGKPRPVVFLRFAGSKRSAAPHEVGEFVNHPTSPPVLILLDRWNERMLTAAGAWIGLGAALERLETVDNVYIYFLTNHGELYPVHPLPGGEPDSRAGAGPSPSELRAKLDQAIQKSQGFRDVDAQDPVLRVNTTFQALHTLTLQMASIAGRKYLIWVTHGVPLTVNMFPGDWLDLTPQIRNLSEAAAQAQIAIYTVDQSASGAGADPSGLARQTLQMFSALTGGRWYPSDSADQAIADATADARASYRLAYYSDVRDGDRKEHKIRLATARKGIRLLTRTAFAARTAEPDPGQVEAIAFGGARSSPFDAAEIGLRVAMSRKPGGNTVHFDIRVDPAHVLIEHRGEHYRAALAVLVALYNNEGPLNDAMSPTDLDIDFTQSQFDRAVKEGMLIAEDLRPSGQIQQTRVIVFDRNLHGLGSVTIPMK